LQHCFSVSEFSGEIRQIVQQAVAELSVEQHLKTYEEVWLSKVFELEKHLRSSSVKDAIQDKSDINDGGIATQVLKRLAWQFYY
jgi:hypothetical protein